MKNLILLAAVLPLLLTAGCAMSGGSEETYEQINYRDNSVGPAEGERPLFPLSPSGGNTYFDFQG
jgi:hypothetical protein